MLHSGCDNTAGCNVTNSVSPYLIHFRSRAAITHRIFRLVFRKTIIGLINCSCSGKSDYVHYNSPYNIISNVITRNWT
jgi:hypothetical protein